MAKKRNRRNWERVKNGWHPVRVYQNGWYRLAFGRTCHSFQRDGQSLRSLCGLWSWSNGRFEVRWIAGDALAEPPADRRACPTCARLLAAWRRRRGIAPSAGLEPQIAATFVITPAAHNRLLTTGNVVTLARATA